MAEAPANPFADAVRSVARSAPDVLRGAVKAGAACAAGLVLLAAAHGMSREAFAERGPGIPGAAEAARAAMENVASARVQSKFSDYYACGLLRQTRKELGAFTASGQVQRIRAMAAETLEGAAAQPRPETSIGQAVTNVAAMARAAWMAGLSRVVDAVVSNPASHAWAGRMQAELDGLPARMAEESRLAGLSRDLSGIDAAEREIEASYQGIGCRI